MNHDFSIRIVPAHDETPAQCLPPESLIQAIRSSTSALVLRECRQQWIAQIKAIYDCGTNSQTLTHLITAVSDEIVKRVIEFALHEHGAAPAPFAFLSLGSEGRQEQTLSSDQDNALIFDDVDEASSESACQYFNAFAQTVCANLDAIGFPLCQGNVMAMNPQWNQPIETWKQYFSGWIQDPDPQALLNLKTFFDFRFVYGEETLIHTLTRHLNEISRGKAAFYQCLAKNTLLLKPPLGLFGNITVLHSREHFDAINIKDAMTPIVDFARIYALHHQVNHTNTGKRLNSLRKIGVVTERTFHDALQSYEVLMQLRLKHQFAVSSRVLQESNYIQPKTLSAMDHAALKNALSRIVDLQTKLRLDFTGTF